MFDSIHLHPQRTEYVTKNVTVHEHKAPTDEAIKLYKELLEKARAEVVSFVVQNGEPNLLSHVKVCYQRDELREQAKIKVVFVLNGKQHEHEFTTDMDTRERMAKAIVNELLSGIMGESLARTLPRT